MDTVSERLNEMLLLYDQKLRRIYHAIFMGRTIVLANPLLVMSFLSRNSLVSPSHSVIQSRPIDTGDRVLLSSNSMEVAY